jgi:hypothetical protein
VCVNHCHSLGRWTTIASNTSQRNKILLHPFSKWTYANVLAMIKQQRNSKNIRSYIRVAIIRLFEGSLCKMRSITCYPHVSSLGKVLPNRRGLRGRDGRHSTFLVDLWWDEMRCYQVKKCLCGTSYAEICFGPIKATLPFSLSLFLLLYSLFVFF